MHSVAFSKDSTLVAACTDENVAIWDVSGAFLKIVGCPAEEVRFLESGFLKVQCSDGMAKTFDKNYDLVEEEESEAISKKFDVFGGIRAVADGYCVKVLDENGKVLWIQSRSY